MAGVVMGVVEAEVEVGGSALEADVAAGAVAVASVADAEAEAAVVGGEQSEVAGSTSAKTHDNKMRQRDPTRRCIHTSKYCAFGGTKKQFCIAT